jgi:hypothetical protein
MILGPENPLSAWFFSLFALISDLLSLPGLNVGPWKETATAEAVLGRNFKILFFGLACFSIVHKRLLRYYSVSSSMIMFFCLLRCEDLRRWVKNKKQKSLERETCYLGK